ncbi:elongation factor Ts, mitochondrial-like [Magnolia sinica]|uniref:elongation factor Ts, mitochondrial-like n=1 Tax=Magnolia sinica TaxID=86752 RepID=UPI002657E096|nr:elongation factor Ts, mitochondrial-like [Magnolia sinica]
MDGYDHLSMDVYGQNPQVRNKMTEPRHHGGTATTEVTVVITFVLGAGLGRIAGILTLEVEDDKVPVDALQQVGSQLAMHIVAAKPLFLSKELVSSEAIESERDILKSQAETTGKSQMAIEKMVEGRLRKYLEEVVLLEQKFVINDSINVKSVLNDLSKEVGSSVNIGKFYRMEVGEGIQRLETSGASEVMAQAA